MNRHEISRRRLLGGSAAAATMLIASSKLSLAANYPSRPITLIVPVSPGGTTDVLMRVAAELVGKSLGQPVVVETRPGAATAVGATLVSNAAPDGYILLAYFGSMLMLPNIQDISFDPIKDFSLIVGQHRFATYAVVREDSPYRTLTDLVEAARKAPGKISVGTAGLATGGHLAVVDFKKKLGVEFLHAPYKGTEYNTALLGGHIDAVFSGANWMGMVDGKLARCIAVFDENRLEAYPDIPTGAELGVPIQSYNTAIIAGPAGLPQDIGATLAAAFTAAHQSPEFKQALAKALCQPFDLAGEELQKWAQDKFQADKELAKDFG